MIKEVKYKEFYEIDLGNGPELYQNQGLLPPSNEYVFSKTGDGWRWTLHLSVRKIENGEVAVKHIPSVRPFME